MYIKFLLLYFSMKSLNRVISRGDFSSLSPYLLGVRQLQSDLVTAENMLLVLPAPWWILVSVPVSSFTVTYHI